VWLVVSPVIAAGVLVAHALSYRITSTPSDPFHAYLGHAPQILLLLAIAGVAVAAFGAPRQEPPVHAFPVVALATFVVQEHLERVLHGGVPILVTSPAFLVGLALQIPVACVAWMLARWMLRAVREHPRPVGLRSRLQLPLRVQLRGHVATPRPADAPSRGPPAPLLSR
jgi:hypothetical protein